MEEEGGDDSEMIDAMDGWDSEDDIAAAGTERGTSNPTHGTDDSGSGGSDNSKKKKTSDEEKKGVDASWITFSLGV